MSVTTRILGPEFWDDVLRVFESTHGCDGCWCFNHHIAPGQPDVRGDAARDAKKAHVEAGRAGGVLGYLDGEPVGWCAVDPRRDIPGHDCVADSEDVWAIHCFFVQARARGHGLARAMLRTALDWLREKGARQVEAYPTPPDREPAFNGFAGPFQLYAQEGFEQTGDFDENFCIVARSL